MPAPSCVSFREMLRSMPDATMASISCTYSRAAAVASSKERDAFAQVVERQVEAGRLQRARGVERLVQGFAGDEPPREAAVARHAVARRQPLQPGAFETAQ